MSEDRARIEPTEADREAARWLHGKIKDLIVAQVEAAGLGASFKPYRPDDDGWMIQFLARHASEREAIGRAAGREEALREIEEQIGEGYDVPSSKVEKCEHGQFGFEDCIACYDEALIARIERVRALPVDSGKDGADG